MGVRLVIESAPHPQREKEREFSGGRMVIGRSDDADWPLHDPDMYVSRQHCILTEQDGTVMATDASSSGLFIDNAAHPVGASNSVAVEPGMRLRMGDFVLRVEAASGASAAPPGAAAASGGGMVFDFSIGDGEAPPPPPEPRPADLPDPFGLTDSARSHERKRPPAPPRPLDQEDAFSLDLRRSANPATPTDAEAAPPPGGGGYFDPLPGHVADAPSPAPASASDHPPSSQTAPSGISSSEGPKDIFADWTRASPAETPVSTPAQDTGPSTGLDPAGATDTAPQNAGSPDAGAVPVPSAHMPSPSAPVTAAEAAPSPAPATPVASGGDDAQAHAALLRGMGLDPAQFTGDPVAQAEQIGRAMRMLVDGLMQQLRTRAVAKQRARVAQTIVARADVNPLKFLATPDEVLASFVQPRGKGYLDAEASLEEAFRDLTDHQLRTWTALQTALRRMIDRFDPEAIETSMAEVGLLESLMAGGRSAKLWRLYEERYREIARAAEDQFLGEVGADFREAYENGRS
ncbi:type VI secretion system protein ImpI [Paracoccus isoporae]|uniref:Type VI secretion system protein ImpI n=1 Tax=Paracoccus isoporae TaxID=591205 RepID=A0A1G7D7Z4_9RHOB|nr:type VI secretion system-associated FHA domain protein TagH [Paracoccus isoporae]SDE47651.1 type VI secretion system protein ImpI [Paracoccus isoporae]